jgi:hypothetical protein
MVSYLRMFSLRFFRNESRYSQRLIKAFSKLHVRSIEKRMPFVGFNIRIRFEEFFDNIEKVRPVLFSPFPLAFLRTTFCLQSGFPSLFADLIRLRALRQHTCFQLYFPRSSFLFMSLFFLFSIVVPYLLWTVIFLFLLCYSALEMRLCVVLPGNI